MSVLAPEQDDGNEDLENGVWGSGIFADPPPMADRELELLGLTRREVADSGTIAMHRVLLFDAYEELRYTLQRANQLLDRLYQTNDSLKVQEVMDRYDFGGTKVILHYEAQRDRFKKEEY